MRLWVLLAIVLIFGFTVLGWIGSRIYQDMPPIPERIVTSEGQVVGQKGPTALPRVQAACRTVPACFHSSWRH